MLVVHHDEIHRRHEDSLRGIFLFCTTGTVHVLVVRGSTTSSGFWLPVWRGTTSIGMSVVRISPASEPHRKRFELFPQFLVLGLVRLSLVAARHDTVLYVGTVCIARAIQIPLHNIIS